ADLQTQLEHLVDNVEFSRTYNRTLVISELKDAYDRMVPTRREVALLKGILYRLNAKLAEGSSITAGRANFSETAELSESPEG
ncbi:MAG: hypothetical protein K2Z81_04140, partial [Cyanobacteria bacterium]|nr:hypothetical protein [Cyanobacteriota bacterium]